MITFHVSQLRTDAPLATHWDVMIHVLGGLRIVVDGRVWYEDPECNVVELADHLATWLRRQPVPSAFEYRSLESSEPWLLRFAERAPCGVVLESPSQLYRDDRAHGWAEIRQTALSFVRELLCAVPERDSVLHLLRAEAGRYDDLLAIVS